MIVRLELSHIDFADNVAALRRSQAFMRARKAHNRAPTNFDGAFAIDRLGARCEVAGKLFLNPIVWHAYAERISGLPDLGDFIDVKGRSKDWHSLIVQKDDEDRWAFLLVDASGHPDYRMVGWLWGHEAKQQEFWNDPAGGRAAFFVPQTSLRDSSELFDEVRRREREERKVA
jgi:hypothetical protein